MASNTVPAVPSPDTLGELTDAQGELREAALRHLWSIQYFIRDPRPEEVHAIYPEPLLETRTPQTMLGDALFAYAAYANSTNGKYPLPLTFQQVASLAMPMQRTAERFALSNGSRERAQRLFTERPSSGEGT